MTPRSRLLLLLPVVALVASGCFVSDGQWHTYGPAGSGADYPYGVILVQPTQPLGLESIPDPDAPWCQLEFETADGALSGRVALQQPTVVNLTPPFTKVRLVDKGVPCLATPETPASLFRRYFGKVDLEQENLGERLNGFCATSYIGDQDDAVRSWDGGFWFEQASGPWWQTCETYSAYDGGPDG